MNLRIKTSKNWLLVIGYLIALSSFLTIPTARAQMACRVFDVDLQKSYVGGCVAGLAEGEGVASGKDEYKGQFKNGVKYGRGRYRWEDGAVYDGMWRHDIRSGYGVQLFPNGNRFEGNFEKGRFSGQGTLSLVKSDKDLNLWMGKGNWIGDLYVITGEFEGSSLKSDISQQKVSRGANTDNGDGTLNGADGVIWQRCALGREWNSWNKNCTGEPVKAAWLNMVELASKDTFRGFKDWRLPTEAEFNMLVGKQQTCSLLRTRLSELFPSVWSGVYFGSHHWLLDNSTALTDPSSANLEPSSRSCTMTNKDLRPHAPQPAVLVRGGTVPDAWQIALSKTPQSQSLSEQSKKAGVAMIEGYNSKLERVAEMFSTPATATTSSSNSTVEWTITNEENGGGLAHWYTKKYNAKCTSGRKSGERITIHLLKSSGKYQEVSGSVKNSLAEAARDACS